MPSPYELALGGRTSHLHPRIRDYIRELPHGSVGRGAGTFDVAGTRHRWARPLVWLAGRGDGIFATRGIDVPFTVENRGLRLARGRVGIVARRVFGFADGTRAMNDLVVAVPDGDGVRLIDRVGRHGRILAELSADVRDGGLVLRSVAVHLRIGPVRMRIPRAVAPVLRLDERIGDDGRQRVDLRVSMPLVGTVYGYRGTFDYRIDEEGAT